MSSGNLPRPQSAGNLSQSGRSGRRNSLRRGESRTSSASGVSEVIREDKLDEAANELRKTRAFVRSRPNVTFASGFSGPVVPGIAVMLGVAGDADDSEAGPAARPSSAAWRRNRVAPASEAESGARRPSELDSSQALPRPTSVSGGAAGLGDVNANLMRTIAALPPQARSAVLMQQQRVLRTLLAQATAALAACGTEDASAAERKSDTAPPPSSAQVAPAVTTGGQGGDAVVDLAALSGDRIPADDDAAVSQAAAAAGMAAIASGAVSGRLPLTEDGAVDVEAIGVANERKGWIREEIVPFLLVLGTALVLYGSTTVEVEDTLAEVALSLGVPVQCSCLPQCITLMVSLDPTRPEKVHTAIAKCSAGGLDATKFAAVEKIVRDVTYGTIVPDEGTKLLLSTLAKPPRWGGRISLIIRSGLISFTMAPRLGAGWGGLLAATVAGLGIGGIQATASFVPTIDRVADISCAATAWVLAVLIRNAGLKIDVVRVVLASIIQLLPGMTITNAAVELAAGFTVAGASRLVGGLFSLIVLVIGLLLGGIITEALKLDAHLPGSVKVLSSANFTATSTPSITPSSSWVDADSPLSLLARAVAPYVAPSVAEALGVTPVPPTVLPTPSAVAPTPLQSTNTSSVTREAASVVVPTTSTPTPEPEPLVDVEAAMDGGLLWVSVVLSSLVYSFHMMTPLRYIPLMLIVGVYVRATSFMFNPSHAAFSTLVRAFLVTILSNLFSRFTFCPPRATLVLGIMALTPGSAGMRSMISVLQSDTSSAMQLAGFTLQIALSITLGLTVANVVLPPRPIYVSPPSFPKLVGASRVEKLWMYGGFIVETFRTALFFSVNQKKADAARIQRERNRQKEVEERLRTTYAMPALMRDVTAGVERAVVDPLAKFLPNPLAVLQPGQTPVAVAPHGGPVMVAAAPPPPPSRPTASSGEANSPPPRDQRQPPRDVPREPRNPPSAPQAPPVASPPSDADVSRPAGLRVPEVGQRHGSGPGGDSNGPFGKL